MKRTPLYLIWTIDATSALVKIPKIVKPMDRFVVAIYVHQRILVNSLEKVKLGPQAPGLFWLSLMLFLTSKKSACALFFVFSLQLCFCRGEARTNLEKNLSLFQRLDFFLHTSFQQKKDTHFRHSEKKVGR
jgi:hypothetical protein